MLDPEGSSLLWRGHFGEPPELADLTEGIGATAREWLAVTEGGIAGERR